MLTTRKYWWFALSWVSYLVNMCPCHFKHGPPACWNRMLYCCSSGYGSSWLFNGCMLCELWWCLMLTFHGCVPGIRLGNLYDSCLYWYWKSNSSIFCLSVCLSICTHVHDVRVSQTERYVVEPVRKLSRTLSSAVGNVAEHVRRSVGGSRPTTAEIMDPRTPFSYIGGRLISVACLLSPVALNFWYRKLTWSTSFSEFISCHCITLGFSDLRNAGIPKASIVCFILSPKIVKSDS